MAQDSALYPSFTVADLLGFGRRLNPGWDDDLARDRLARLGIPLRKRVRQLSGGQRAQCALVLAMAKRPDLLLLDEPLASLDPLARHDVMALLMEMVALHGTTIILSSHIIADLVETCDWLVAVNRRPGPAQRGDRRAARRARRWSAGRARHARCCPTGCRWSPRAAPDARSTCWPARPPRAFGPAWTVRPPSLDELVRGYLGAPDATALPGPTVAVR